MKTKRQGPDDWEDLIGSTFDILRDSGMGVMWEEVDLDSVYLSEDEFGVPVYYLLDEDWGGCMYRYTEEVEVRKHV